jgi:hypothetical protein
VKVTRTNRFRGGEYLGVRIPTLFDENVATRCAGCGEVITGIPFRVSIMDIAPTEGAPSWAVSAPLNPGPHQFHADPSHFRAWARRRNHLICRLSDVREIMRPVAVPGEVIRYGLCDGLHRQAHELVPA